MGRLHAPGKGKSGSLLPYRRKVPNWVTQTVPEIVEVILKMAKKGMVPSQIGVILRDMYAIPQVRHVTGSKILRILKSHGVAPSIPEDLYFLIKKAINVRKHLEVYRKDIDSKFRLILIEARIHRLARYYRQKKVLHSTWKYEAATASALVA